VLKKSVYPVNQFVLWPSRCNLQLGSETPVQQFQRELQENSRAALQSKRERLDQHQKQYQDPNPQNVHWQTLWKAKRSQDGISERLRNLEHQKNEAIADIQNQSAIPTNDSPMMSPEERRNSPRQKQLEALDIRKKRLEQEIALLKSTQLQMEYEFPALSAIAKRLDPSIAGESENTGANNGLYPNSFTRHDSFAFLSPSSEQSSS
jgi:hypothetical protein